MRLTGVLAVPGIQSAPLARCPGALNRLLSDANLVHFAGPKFGPVPSRPYLATGLLVAVHTKPTGNLPTYVT